MSPATHYIHFTSPCTPSQTHLIIYNTPGDADPDRNRAKMAIKWCRVYQPQAAAWRARSARLMVPVTPKHGRWKYTFIQLSDPIPSSERREEGRGAGEAHTVPTCQQPLHFIIY